MRPRKRLAFGLRTYSNLTARRARARIDNRIFDAEMAGEGEYYTVSPRIKKLVSDAEDSIERMYAQAAEEEFDDWGEYNEEDFEPNEDTEMFCDWEDDEVADPEISAANWCECGIPRAACHLHDKQGNVPDAWKDQS